jgi:hydroxymethylpyrimidine/phosphomethylpyrimidine kinase
MIEHIAVLTVAGSDSGGGAGIQADLKTFAAFGVYGTSVITAVTAQNLSGVSAVQPVEADVVRRQLLVVLSGYPVRAIKTGMLFSAEIVEAVAGVLAGFRSIPLVIDPVFAATSGSRLIEESGIQALITRLFPMASLITPNMPEAEIVTGTRLKEESDLERAAAAMFARFGVPVLLKGGHLGREAVDVLRDAKGYWAFRSEMVKNVNTHGTGCTFSAAIAAEMAKGTLLRPAIESAKSYIYECLRHSHSLTPEVSVLDHFCRKERDPSRG